MKKWIYSAAMLCLCTGTLVAQNMTVTAERTTFGLRAGVNFQNINGRDDLGNDLQNKIRTGFHAGLNAEIPVGEGFYLQPGLLYSQKGATGEQDSRLRVNYLELPVNFVYKPVLGSGSMLLGFGPYVAYGLNGSLRSTTGDEGDIDFDTDVKRFDAGGNLLVGYEWSRKISLQLNAQLGLANINQETNISGDKTRWRNTGFGLSAGYRF